MNRSAAPFWGLLAVGAAAAVGATTRDAGFTALTFIGSLVLPRVLGLRGGHHHHGCAGRHARGHLEDRLTDWHRHAHGDAPQDAAPVA